MFRKSFFLTMVLLLIAAISGGVLLAQDNAPSDAEPADYFARYEGIPTSRTEDGGFVLGDPDAPIAMVEFADFLCPACQDYQEVAHAFIENYVETGEARFEYRLFPVVNPTYSPYSAQLAECVDAQIEGGFWPAHDLLYDLAVEQNIGPDTAQIVADVLEVDFNELVSCAETADQYQIDATLASANGIGGTPSIMVRLENGDLGFVTIQGQTFNRGGLPLEILDLVMEAEDVSEVVQVPQPPQQLLDDRLLTNVSLTSDEACTAPCWQGITPGETAWDEAVNIVQSIEKFTGFDPRQGTEGNQALIWREEDGIPCCVIQTEDGVNVDSILLYTAPDTTIGEIIEIYSEPTYVLALTASSQAGEISVFAIYQSQGLILQVYGGTVDENAFSAESPIVRVQYQTQELIDEAIESTPLFDWAGYEALEDYFPQGQ